MKGTVDRILNMYRRVARALPEDFRKRHGNDMVQATEDLMHYVARRRGPTGLIPVVVHVFTDLFWRIPVEHAAEFRLDTAYGLSLGARRYDVLRLVLKEGRCAGGGWNCDGACISVGSDACAGEFL